MAMLRMFLAFMVGKEGDARLGLILNPTLILNPNSASSPVDYDYDYDYD